MSIGTDIPASLFHVTTASSGVGVTTFEQINTSADGYDLNFRKARGVAETPSVITTADQLGSINFNGYSGAGGYITGAAIKAISEGTVANNRIPAHLSFWTGTDAASTVLTERMRIDKAGNVGIGTINPLARLDVHGVNAAASTVVYTTIFNVSSSDLANPLAIKMGLKTDALLASRYGAIEVDDAGAKRPLVLQPATTGNVGVGTTTPGAKLEINSGTFNISGLKFTQFVNGSVVSPNISGSVLSLDPSGNVILVADKVGTDSLVLVGTGIANYVTRWLNANTLGTGAIYDNGRVGILTTTPGSELSVAGGVAVGTYGVGTGAPGNGLIVSGSGGFGTAVPLTKMDVRGLNVKTTTAAYEHIIQAASADGVSPLTLRMGIKTDGVVTNRYGAIEVDDAGTKRNLALQPSGGNVGIGTTSPGFPLNFANTLGDKIALWGNSGATYGFGIQASLLQVHTDGSGSDIAFGYGASGSLTENMRIKGNGNVGIGTSAPAEKLDIVGSARLSSLVNADTVMVQADINGKLIPMSPGTASQVLLGTGVWGEVPTSTAWSLTGNGGTGAGTNFIGTTDATDLVVKTNGAERIRIVSAGNVGIGTALPKNKLDVEGGIAVGVTYSGTTVAPANGAIIEGNVGIGTNAPGFPLNFANTLGDKISLYGNAGATFGFGIQNSLLQIHTSLSAADIAFGYGASATMTENMRIKGNGNVGIGTATPLSKLDIEGGVAIGSTYSGTTVAPVNGAIVEGSVGIGTTTPANKLDVEGGAAIGSVYSGTSSAPVNGLIVQGNVGIGTATPATSLEVAGQVKITGGAPGDGKILTSDATGLASWKNKQTITSVAPPCQSFAAITTAPGKLADLATFTKNDAATGIEVVFQTNIYVEDLSPGTDGVKYELQIDNVPAANNAGQTIYFIDNGGAVTAANYNQVTLFATFTGLSAGVHTVSLYVSATSGTATGAHLDAGCFNTSNVTIIEN